jgi:cold shock CspA family protein
MTSRQQGVIKNWFHDRAFGFIKPDGGSSGDVFCHVTSLPDGIVVNVGDKVSFETKEDQRSKSYQRRVSLKWITSPPASARSVRHQVA